MKKYIYAIHVLNTFLDTFLFHYHKHLPVSPAQYFNQRLLNFNQYFPSDAGYLFFARSVYEQHHHVYSSINLAIYNIKPGILTAGTVKSNFKGTIERFLGRDNAISFMSSVKGTPIYWKQFYMMY